MESVEILNNNQIRAVSSDRDLIDIQVATAKSYPRNVTRFLENCKVAISLTKEIAESCVYTLPKANKPTGPSVYLARIILQNYGNIRVESKIVETQLKSVTAEAVAWELEANAAVKIQVQRSIWGKNGRYSDDMIAVTSNAAIAIALRNAVFNVIPREYTDRLLDIAKRAIIGDISDAVKFTAQRRRIVNGLKDIYGVSEKEVISFCGKQAVENLNEDDLIRLIGIGNALKAGDLSVDEAFRPQKNKFIDSNLGESESENRLLLLIKDSKTIQELEKHKQYLKTNEQRIAYDTKFKEINDKIK